jgi:hypothetical protein
MKEIVKIVIQLNSTLYFIIIKRVGEFEEV